MKVAPASKKHVDPGTRTRTRTIAGRTVTLHSAVCMRCLSECARIGYCRHTLPQACTPNFAGAIFPIGRRPTAHKASCASGHLERRWAHLPERVAQQACCSCPCLSFLRPCRQSPSVPEPEPVSDSFSFSKARSFYAYCSPSCSLHSVGLGDLFGGREGGQAEKENERGGRGGRGGRERERERKKEREREKEILDRQTEGDKGGRACVRACERHAGSDRERKARAQGDGTVKARGNAHCRELPSRHLDTKTIHFFKHVHLPFFRSTKSLAMPLLNERFYFPFPTSVLLCFCRSSFSVSPSTLTSHSLVPAHRLSEGALTWTHIVDPQMHYDTRRRKRGSHPVNKEREGKRGTDRH